MRLSHVLISPTYINMVYASLRNSIPKSVVHCQVHEAKREVRTPNHPTLPSLCTSPEKINIYLSWRTGQQMIGNSQLKDSNL